MARILITGGSGFLGKRLALALRKQGHAVILGGRNNKQNKQAEAFTGCEAVYLDVSQIESVRDVVLRSSPEIIIHAAATKFVDLAEKYPFETVDINVVGSENVARVAMENNVGLVVGISTDKSAPPIRNTYGLTKALMERIFCSLDGVSKTRLFCVRYGNVAWSTGSVLCIWKKMLKDTGVIKTTGPEMLRFFFTVDDAVGLITTALEHREEVYGKVIGREMKAAKLKDILDIWIKQENGKYEQGEKRPGERNIELLVGQEELPYTTTKVFHGTKHFIISFNKQVADPLQKIVTCETVARLSEKEILDLINNPPVEEEQYEPVLYARAGHGRRAG